MAGIEKICEFSGEYCGWSMYGYKHNQLQIMPKYRKLFRKANYTLTFKKGPLYWNNGVFTYAYNPKEYTWYEPPFKNEEEFITQRKSEGNWLTNEYQFVLTVTDPELQGNVEGEYVNWTFDLPTTKRKLKRLLRCRELVIQWGDDYE